MKKLNAFWEKLIDWARKAGLYLLTCFGVGYGICSIIRVAVNLKELIKYVYHWEDLD